MLRRWNAVFESKFVRDHCMLKRWEIKLDTDMRPLVSIQDIAGNGKLNASVARTIASSYVDKTITDLVDPNKWSETFTVDPASRNSQLLVNDAVRAVIGPNSECMSQESVVVDLQTRARDFISRALNGIGNPPEKFQAAFILTMASILLPNVVGELAWREIGPVICREMGWNFLNTINFRYVIAQAARRLGKTRGTSELILNYVLSTPDTHCLVYSNSDAQTQLLREDIRHLIDLGQFIYVGNQKVMIKDLIVSDGHRKMTFINPYNRTKFSSIFFIPGINSHTMDMHVRTFSFPFIYTRTQLLSLQFSFLFVSRGG